MIKIKNKDFEKETVLEVGKFAILWNIFENEKCNKDCSIEKLRNIAEIYETSIKWEDLALALRKRADNQGVNFSEYVDEYLSLGNGLNGGQKEEVKKFLESGGHKNLSGGLIAIYRIRNNIFHGLKDWTLLDEQIDLFQSLNTFLEEII